MKDDKDLNGELEDIAELFRTEFKKASEKAEKELAEKGIVIQQFEEETEEISKDELCACCGEKPVDKAFGESSEYCEECREAMKRYPFSAISIAICLVLVATAIVSVCIFAMNFNIFNTVREGDAYLKENRLTMALDSYEGALSACEDDDVNARRIHLKTAEIMTKTMPEGVYSMQEIPEHINKALSSFELGLPIYSKYEDMRKDALLLYGTMQRFYAIVNKDEYASFTSADAKIYNAIMEEIDGIIGTEIEITAKDGKSKEKYTANEAMVQFCKYMFAYSAGRNDEAYEYMRKVSKSGPQYVWLYAYELGIASMQNGDFDTAGELAKALYETNSDSADAYALYSSYFRMIGNSDKAIEWAKKGIERNETNAELYRLQAMAHISNGDFGSAKECCDTAMNYDNYGLLYMVAIVAENELGNADKVTELKTLLANQGLELSEKMENYLNGKISAEKMFTEGTGDTE